MIALMSAPANGAYHDTGEEQHRGFQPAPRHQAEPIHQRHRGERAEKCGQRHGHGPAVAARDCQHRAEPGAADSPSKIRLRERVADHGCSAAPHTARLPPTRKASSTRGAGARGDDARLCVGPVESGPERRERERHVPALSPTTRHTATSGQQHDAWAAHGAELRIRAASSRIAAARAGSAG